MAEISAISNDARGWIMTALSGVACVFGASFIYVDIAVRQFPGKRNFNIRDSNTFISLSLSLSFGVMIFSALYNMLPSAKSSLTADGFSSKKAAWILIACFIGGVIGIQFLSRLMHHYIPHDVVPCEHTHQDEESYKEGAPPHQHENQSEHEHAHSENDHAREVPRSQSPGWGRTADRKLQHLVAQRLSSQHSHQERPHNADTQRAVEQSQNNDEQFLDRPTLTSKLSNTIAKFASGQDPSCDCLSPCHGYSDLCQSNCFKNGGARGSLRPSKPTMGINRPSAVKSATATESTPLLHNIAEEPLLRPHTRAANENLDSHPSDSEHDLQNSGNSSSTFANECDHSGALHKTHSHNTTHSTESSQSPTGTQHHHHVPTNAFASIGLQTCIAIALHKLPEGFITYATNHANPKLGVSVFLALFIHNITEGFVMALPLYLAINNRVIAMLITFVLGGLSQPAGAGVAALWFKLAGKQGWTPSEAAYGAMFAITAGIMASVALQLYAEAVDKAHSKNLSMVAAFAGMFIMGCSSALTA